MKKLLILFLLLPITLINGEPLKINATASISVTIIHIDDYKISSKQVDTISMYDTTLNKNIKITNFIYE
jgi:hypothetical protein